MTEDRAPSEKSNRDRIVEEVVEQVEQSPSVDVPHEEVETRAEEAVDGLIDRPVQTFTPLLAQNQVMGGLMADSEAASKDETDEQDRS